jgi:transposase
MNLATLLADNHRLQAELASERAALAEERLRRAAAEAKVQDLLRRLFGPKSEKLDPRQYELALEAAQADAAVAAAPPPAPVAAERSPTARRGGGRRPVPAHLPVERIVVDLPAAQTIGLVKIREEITTEIDYVPSRFVRREYVRPVYADPGKGPPPQVAPLPARVIPGSGVGTALLAHVTVAKYADHLPLYRQAQIAARLGVDLPRQKLCRWTEQVAVLLQTVATQLAARILAARYVQADETPVRVLDPERPGAARQSWLWTYHAPTAAAIVFDFQLSRGRDSPARFFPPDWQGQVQHDGYEVYPSLWRDRPGVTEFGCLAHARRKWCEAIEGGGEPVAAILADFAQLYRIEAEARTRGLSGTARAQLRQARCPLLLDRLYQRIERVRAEVLPQSAAGKAAAYALQRWPQLTRYSEPGYGQVEIDNNLVENGIRPSALGKKNWLFIGHPDAGWKSAVIYSVLGTCKLLRLDPEAYLNWVLPRLAAATNQTADGLLPHDYAAVLKELR